MFPILYAKDETSFIHNGLGVLSGAVSSVGEEELNGLFELKIEYDSDGFLADVIENDMIVKAKVNDKQDPQLFRIYAINKSLENDNLIINAQHITYDAAGNFVESLELDDVTTAQAMAAIQANLAYPSKITFSSSNTTTRSSTKLYRTNPLQMVAGIDGSILDHWGGEIERDNFRIVMHKRRGSDDGVLIAYKKNLTGLEAKFDTSKVITRIFPYKIIRDEETEEEQVITIPGKYIDSPNINKYPFIRILPVDYSEDESVTDQESLQAKASTYFNSGSKDLPTVSMEVEFEPLWDTEEYKDVAALERVGMGDTVTVHHSKMGVDVKAHVVKIEYDTIAEKNRKVTIGDVQARFTDYFNRTKDDVENKVKQAHQTAQEAVQAANGKNTNFYGPNQPSNPKKDDLWFKVVDGEYTRTYRFDGIQWQLVVDMEVNSTKEEAQKARDDAQSAVDRANKATQDAQDAIAEAQKGFDAANKANDIASVAKQMSETASSVASDAYKQAGTAITNAQSALDSAEKSLSDISKLDQSVQTQISNINGQLSSKVSQSTFNVLQGTVNTHTTQIQQTLTDISSKADKTLVDTIKKTVDSHSTLISQNATDIKARATQSSVDTLTGRVTTAEANISINAKAITQNMLEVTNNYATKSSLSQTANSLTSTISQVQTNLDNLQIGGRNLLKNTDFSKQENINKLGALSPVSSLTISKLEGFDGDFVFARVPTAEVGDRPRVTLRGSKFSIIEGETYTLSWVGITSSFVNSDFNYTLILRGGVGFRVDQYLTKKKIGTATYGSYTYDVYQYQTTFVAQWSDPEAYPMIGTTVTNARSTWFRFGSVKLERGSKRTDWTPAPEDMATLVQFSSLEQTLNGFTTRVGNAEGSISSLQQTANSLSSKITGAEKNISTLTQTANGLQTQVSDNKKNISTVTQLANALQSRMSDAEGSISTLTQTTSSLSSTINNTKDNLQSQISQLDKNINLRVTKKDLINQINIDTTGILIQGKKLILDGDTTVTGTFKVDNANIKSIDAGKINAGTLEAFDIVGSTIRGSTFTAEDKFTNNTISISTGSIDSQGESQKDKTKKYFARLNGGVFSSEIKTSNTQVDGYNKVTIQPDLILFEAGDSYGSGSPYKKSNFSISSGKAAGQTKLDMYIQAFGVDSPNLRLLASDDIILSSGPPSVIDLNGLLVRRGYDELLTLYDRKTYKDGSYTDPVAKVRADIVGDLMAPTDGGDAYARTNFEFRVTDKASQGKETQNYRDIRARDLYLTNGIEMGSKGVISTRSGYIVVRTQLDEFVYLQGKEVRATAPSTTTSSYIPVRASSFPTGSLEEFKQDIKLWTESALAIINAAD
ncbi:hypothetical protein B5V89_05060, partial [Heyndrickxia sporothermodurans]|uniref:phage tail spike protein n=1 Tax=Heyndrickxia sporothermodurans TaxID=46224 RepID=UPI000D488EFB